MSVVQLKQRRVPDRLLIALLHARRIQVQAHRADGTTSTLGAEDLLTGEDLLPGYSVRVRDLFR